jgi:hypothetical protein
LSPWGNDEDFLESAAHGGNSYQNQDGLQVQFHHFRSSWPPGEAKVNNAAAISAITVAEIAETVYLLGYVDRPMRSS